MCTTEGSPLPDVAVIDGKLPNGVTLRRYPDGKGSWLVLSGTPTEHGKFTVRVAATTPGHRSEATFEVNVAADQTGEITSYQQGEERARTHATRGPDGAMWYTYEGGDRIGRIDRNGSILDPRSAPGVDHPHDITGGPDNEIWFTNAGGNSIGPSTARTSSSSPARASANRTASPPGPTARSGSRTCATTRSAASPPTERDQLPERREHR